MPINCPPEPSEGSKRQQAGIRKTAFRLWVATSMVFCLGYALVPLYDAFCDWTGLMGRTGSISAAELGKIAGSASSRQIAVEFDTNVRGNLPWQFTAKKFRIKVNTGDLHEAWFTVRNTSDRAIVGRAIPSVAPSKSGPYFKKTECFCFKAQSLEPGESREMVVRFVVDTELPRQLSTLTLSYSFFEVPDGKKAAKS
ncbi:MAG: cytochrome c oxidase assembly protein [Candidatus Eutrophobiaceae bacterium]